jgi:hypothetical protein
MSFAKAEKPKNYSMMNRPENDNYANYISEWGEVICLLGVGPASTSFD